MIGNALLPLGIVLTTASQLRLPGLPLGIGEVCLVLWLSVASLRLLTIGRICNAGAVLRIGMFWACFIFAMSIGTCVAFFSNDLALDSMSHDALAYLLVAAITCVFAATMQAGHPLRQTQWLLIAFWNVALVLQLAMGWHIISLPSVDPWYWDRFRGWSENPNQVALYCAVFTPLSLGLALSSQGWARVAAYASCLVAFGVGRLTKSDTFLVAMTASLLLFLALQLRTWLISPEHRLSLRFAVAVFVTFAAAPLALALTPYAVATADDFESLAISFAKDRGGVETKRTAALRLKLWDDALTRGTEAGSLGLGPGPHLERPDVINRVSLPRPFEAHSTILDIYMQGGLLAVLAIFGLFAGVIVLLLQARLDALAAMTTALAIFSISHFILRHPIVWFALALCLILGSARTSSPPARLGT